MCRGVLRHHTQLPNSQQERLVIAHHNAKLDVQKAISLVVEGQDLENLSKISLVPFLAHLVPTSSIKQHPVADTIIL